jgi:hypothetical protein
MPGGEAPLAGLALSRLSPSGCLPAAPAQSKAQRGPLRGSGGRTGLGMSSDGGGGWQGAAEGCAPAPSYSLDTMVGIDTLVGIDPT